MPSPLDELKAFAPGAKPGKPALKGIRVVDLTHFVAGPACTMLLADLGAEVIKIESTGRGDEFRYYPPKLEGMGDEGAPFQWANTNKRSIAIDLKKAEGVALAMELVARADILVENYATGALERLGLGYAACQAVNPRLIYCSATAYGREGRFADRRGHDPIVQAESGFLSMNGYPDRDGVRTGSVVMDISTGFLASNAILAALHARHESGRGQLVEVSLFDSAITMLGFASMQYLVSGETPGRFGNTSPDTSPTGVFHARDRPFYLSCSNNRIYERLTRQVLECPDLASDPRFRDRNDRREYRAALFDLLETEFACKDWVEWEQRFRAAGVPAGPVRDVGEALLSAEAQDRQLVSRIPHPKARWVPHVAMPYRLSDTPPVTPVAAPILGQHTREILAELGISSEQAGGLLAQGIVRGADAATEPSASRTTELRP